MSRVHCLECGNQVVVDPRGLCPDGHEVGTQGARIEHAIGQDAVHPDEPEPWVYTIGTQEVGVPARPPAVGALLSAGGNGDGPARRARPLRAPGRTDDAAGDGSGDAESLLRELHSLAALDEALAEQGRHPVPAEPGGQTAKAGSAPSASAPPPPPQDPAGPADVTDTAMPIAVDTTPPRPTRGDPSTIADAFAELSGLDDPSSTPGRPATSSPGHPSTTPPGADGTPPTPPSAPSESRDETNAAAAIGDQRRSELEGDGLLFSRGDAPDPNPDAAGDAVGHRSGDGTGQPEQSREQEYEATLHVVGTPRRRRSSPPQGPALRTDDGATPTAVPPPAPVAARPPEAVEHDRATPNGHRVAVGEGYGPDLSSFTARGGTVGRKARGRRRRLTR